MKSVDYQQRITIPDLPDVKHHARSKRLTWKGQPRYYEFDKDDFRKSINKSRRQLRRKRIKLPLYEERDWVSTLKRKWAHTVIKKDYPVLEPLYTAEELTYMTFYDGYTNLCFKVRSDYQNENQIKAWEETMPDGMWLDFINRNYQRYVGKHLTDTVTSETFKCVISAFMNCVNDVKEFLADEWALYKEEMVDVYRDYLGLNNYKLKESSCGMVHFDELMPNYDALKEDNNE